MRNLTIGLICVAGLASGSPSRAQTPAPAPPDAAASTGVPTPAEMHDLIESSRATARAARQLVDYNRVMPDLLTQILAKLDKIEDKLGKLEDAVKAEHARPARR